MRSTVNKTLAFMASAAAFAVIVLAGYAPGAGAHQQKTAMTTLLFNDRTGKLEITHKFYIHDAEHAVKGVLNNNKADLIGDPETRIQFGRYVQDHFRLRVNPQTPLKLTYVGHELEGKYFWVYQEVAIPTALTQLEIFHDSLQQLWPSQTNLINIEGRGTTKSLRFITDDGWQRVYFGTAREHSSTLSLHKFSSSGSFRAKRSWSENLCNDRVNYCTTNLRYCSPSRLKITSASQINTKVMLF